MCILSRYLHNQSSNCFAIGTVELGKRHEHSHVLHLTYWTKELCIMSCSAHRASLTSYFYVCKRNQKIKENDDIILYGRCALPGIVVTGWL